MRPGFCPTGGGGGSRNRRYFWMIRIEQILSIGWQKIRGDNSNGGGKGIRTLDPSVANAVLSQLSYAPTEAFSDQLSAVSKKDRLILDFRIIEDRPFVKHLSLFTFLQITNESIIYQTYFPKISPHPSFPKRGIPPFFKGRPGGI